MVGSICISTMATMANPESRAEVRLEAFSFARLKFRVFQWKMLSSMPWLPILEVEIKIPWVVFNTRKHA